MATKRARPSRPASRATTPSEFAPGVFVGNWEDAQRFEGARFCVLDEAPEDMPPATHVAIYAEATDTADPKALDRLAASMQRAHLKGEPVLVFCHQGRYRSPLGAAWYLHRTEGLSLDEAFERVRAARPVAKVASGWVGNYAELERA